jgi:hypothetical protein
MLRQYWVQSQHYHVPTAVFIVLTEVQKVGLIRFHRDMALKKHYTCTNIMFYGHGQATLRHK